MLTYRSIRFQEPFWPVALVSGSLALLTLVVLLVVYGQTGRWQYIALSGVVALIVVAHGVGSGLVRWRRRFDRAIWLIATSQILSVVLIPLFMADYLFIGLFLLVVVPIEVGVADQPQRMPVFAIFSLLGAAGMVATDLLALPNRLAILADWPGATFMAAGLLILQGLGSVWLLWHFRLRAGASHQVRFDLTTQLSLVFTVISALSILIVSGVLIAQIRTSQITQVGQNFQNVAELNVQSVGNTLEQRVNVLLFLAREPTILAGLTIANAAYPESTAAARQQLVQLEQRWQSSPKNSDFVRPYLSGPQTDALNRFRRSNAFYNNLFLLDRWGGLVATQGEKPAQFFYGDEAWWQTVWNDGQGGLYVGQLMIDPETRIASLFIAVRVLTPQTNEFIGVLASNYEIRDIQQDIHLAKQQTIEQVELLAPDGVVIASSDEQVIGQSAWESSLAMGLPSFEEAKALSIEPGWLLGTDRYGHPAVLAYAPLNVTSKINLDTLRTMGWQVVVSASQANALAEVTRSTKVASLVGLLVMALGVLAATATARLITRPIEALTITAAAISEGDLERQAQPVGPVELVTLAEAFNTLTTRLRTLINSLQDQVAQRTAQLETLFRQEHQQRQIAESLHQVATILNTSLDRDTVLAKIMEQLGRVIRYDRASIFLQEGDDLVITRSAVLADVYLDYRIPLASEDPAIRVFKQRQPLIIADVRLDPHGEVWEASDPIRSWMGAPLLTSEQAIGVLAVDNFEISAYSEEDAQVLQIFANQAAIAIENARLYTEAQEARVATEAANRELSQALKNLQATQRQLVEAEKMAALGGLVAGVAHEINTPVGVGVTAASLLEEKTSAFRQTYQSGQMKRSDLEKYLDLAGQTSQMILSNLQRAAELIQSFKQVAVDQSSEERRRFAVKAYLDEILLSLHPKLKRTQLTLDIHADDHLTLDSYPGTFAQIVTNLVMNSLIHAYEPDEPGQLVFDLRQENGRLIFEYADDGRGIPKKYLGKIFEPFFTTKRGQGGSGLGLHIIYNLVTQKLGGVIRCESQVDVGTRFIIELPLGEGRKNDK